MDLNEFTLKYIREKNLKWMEEKRLEWIPLISEFLSQVIEGKSVLIITDYKRKWLRDYILQKINNFQDFKPSFIPFFDLISFIPQIEYAKTNEHFDLIEDMLNITFNENYIFWYIGVETPMLKFARRKENSFFWIMDMDLHKNFFLKSIDENLDLKLLHLTDLLNETLKAVIFGEVEL
jgi:hypothetical protein